MRFRLWFRRWWDVPVCAAVFAAAFAAQVVNVRAETCRASYYGSESGHWTANGERFKPDGLSIALRRRPGRGASVAFYRVRYGSRVVVARHNDVGPAAWTRRCADVSRGVARALGFERAGVATVTITRLR